MQTCQSESRISQEPSKEIKAVVDSVLGAFNSKTPSCLTTRSAVKWQSLIGSLGRWSSPNAQACWWAEAERLAEELGVASEHISVERTLHC
jgi:hypothetical protein